MYNTKRTKIIATIGPSSDYPEVIEELIKAGVNIFRFNMKHNTLEWHKERIELVKRVSHDLNIPIGTYVDLQGPEIRIETFNKLAIPVKKDDELLFSTTFDTPSKMRTVKITQSEVFDALDVDDKFSIDDGLNEFIVTRKIDNGFYAISLDSGEIKSNKGFNLMGKDVKLPSLTPGDLDRLRIAQLVKADFIGLSFTRRKEDVQSLRVQMDKLNIKAHIIAKVESHSGVENIDEIIEHSDVVMVARGDLGVEVPFERVTYIQKEIIHKCRMASKPVIVATQMLESMINSPKPTRAEVADVSNAVFDGADCVMLSAESATGKYPVKAVEAMRRIIRFNEEKANFSTFSITPKNQTQLLINSAISMIHSKGDLKIDKIIVFTETGYTARVISSFRGHTPIIAVSNSHETVDTLTISYGVIPVIYQFPKGDFMLPEYIVESLKENNYLKSGELVLVVHGKRWSVPGGTNAAVIVTV